jgi:hypothetical protein
MKLSIVSEAHKQPNHPWMEEALRVNRRHFFGRQATGIGGAALASLLNKEGLLGAEEGYRVADNSGLAGLPHHAPRAKRIIYLFQNGAPTHVDLFDYKPELIARHGKPIPESFFQGKRFSTMTGDPTGKVMLQPVELKLLRG